MDDGGLGTAGTGILHELQRRSFWMRQICCDRETSVFHLYTFSELENGERFSISTEQRPEMKLIPCAPCEGFAETQRLGRLCADFSTP